MSSHTRRALARCLRLALDTYGRGRAGASAFQRGRLPTLPARPACRAHIGKGTRFRHSGPPSRFKLYDVSRSHYRHAWTHKTALAAAPLNTFSTQHREWHCYSRRFSQQWQAEPPFSRLHREFLQGRAPEPRGGGGGGKKPPSPRAPPKLDKRVQELIFSGPGRILGLATFGVLAIRKREERAPKLYQNINDIFNLVPAGSPEKEKTERKKRENKFDRCDSYRGDRSRLGKGEDFHMHFGGREDDVLEDAVLAEFLSKVNQDGSMVLREEDFKFPQRWKQLGLFLASNSQVTSLRLQGMNISKEEASLLGKSVLKEIRHVTFCDNELGVNDGALDVLVTFLLCCSWLESAAFLRNSISDIHVPQLMTLVTNHQRLSKLDLCWNGIRDKGALQIADTIKQLKDSVLDRLDLSYNLIGSKGVSSLERARRQFYLGMGTSLELSLMGNMHMRRNTMSFKVPLTQPG